MRTGALSGAAACSTSARRCSTRRRPTSSTTRTILGDLVGPGELAVLVVPIDKEAPRGRLILPQVQTHPRPAGQRRHGAGGQGARAAQTPSSASTRPPKLVVTDSQAFLKVAADTPPDVPLTSFSILFARFKGDLTAQVEGALAIERPARAATACSIAEACSHHPIGEDIGRVKIPRWLTQYVGGKLEFDARAGPRLSRRPVAATDLVVHCGACTFNRREMLGRILRCREAGVPITNYGLAIAYSLGIFERALQPFPAALEVVRRGRTHGVPRLEPAVTAAAVGDEPVDDL